MKLNLPRPVLFVAMVSLGLLTVWLLSDPVGGRKHVAIGELEPQRDQGRVRITDNQQGRDVQVLLGEVEFDVVQREIGEDGQVSERPVYKVRMVSGGPDPSGAFLAHQPVIRLLDRRTGAERGVVRADNARFETEGAVGGTVTLDFGRMRAQNFSLLGNVEGDFPMGDGLAAHLSAGSLEVIGRVVTGPGFVTWSRPDMALSGFDMTWDGEAGRLNFDFDAHLFVAATDVQPSREFHAPGGLTWVVPPSAEDASQEQHGELRGRVTGESGDGTRLQADTLRFHGAGGRLVLDGSSVLERDVDGRLSRLTAQHIRVDSDEQGRLALAEADGGVRLVMAPLAVMPAWMVTEELRLEGDEARAPGRVTWARDDLVATGVDMTWQRAEGQLVFERDAELAVQEGGDHALAGVRLVAPGGMNWTLPEGASAMDAARGELRGGVKGTAPDGSELAGEVLFFDGPARTFRLEGDSSFTQHRAERATRIDAERITVTAGEDRKLAFVSAEGQVLVLTGPVDLLPTRLVTDRLERRDRLVTSPGVVTWMRDDLTIVGTGMRWNELEGHLDFERDATLHVLDPAKRIDLELAAEGGLSWRMPPESINVLAEGRGELRGRVTGSASDGSRLETDRLLVDGPANALQLLGPSTVVVADGAAPTSLSSDALTIESIDTTPRIRTDRPASWVREGLRGQGTGLDWDREAGTLALDRDVSLEFVDAEGRPRWTMQSGGSLNWELPPGATDLLREGRGEAHGGVTGTGPDGQRFAAETLVVGREEGLMTLYGSSSFERGGQGELLRVAAQRRLDVRSGQDTTARHVTAEGAATGWFASPGAPTTRIAGDTLVMDRDAGLARAQGTASFERDEDGRTLSLTAADRIIVHTGPDDALRRVEARGDVIVKRDFEAHGQELVWDVSADQATLSGRCRLLFSGAWMTAERVELQPRAETFRILRSILNLDG